MKYTYFLLQKVSSSYWSQLPYTYTLPSGIMGLGIGNMQMNRQNRISTIFELCHAMINPFIRHPK